jgi:hypothetical protein
MSQFRPTIEAALRSVGTMQGALLLAMFTHVLRFEKIERHRDGKLDDLRLLFLVLPIQPVT